MSLIGQSNIHINIILTTHQAYLGAPSKGDRSTISPDSYWHEHEDICVQLLLWPYTNCIIVINITNRDIVTLYYLKTLI